MRIYSKKRDEIIFAICCFRAAGIEEFSAVYHYGIVHSFVEVRRDFAQSIIDVNSIRGTFSPDDIVCLKEIRRFCANVV